MIRKWKTNEIGIRDPFIFLWDDKYYMYGTRNQTTWGKADGFDVYISNDLSEWEGPVEIFHNDGSFWATESYWAPECIYYKGKFYLIATFGAENTKKGIQFLKADVPAGPFVPITDEPVTPREWTCIDGTFYLDEDQKPWLIFSHGMPEEIRGAMCAVQLSEDLTETVGEPVIMFYADEAKWALPVPFAEAEFGVKEDTYFTDGPYIFKSSKLSMIWSSWGENGYSMGIAESESGKINGPWKHHEKAFYTENGGHGMIFQNKEGEYMLALHSPNDTLKERAVFLPFLE